MGDDIFLIDLEKKSVELISRDVAYCFTKVNYEIVLYGGIRKFYLLYVNTAKSNCCSKEFEFVIDYPSVDKEKLHSPFNPKYRN